MSEEGTVIIVYREGGLEEATLTACRDQWPDVQLRLTPTEDIYAYADTIRMHWPYPQPIVWVEQDVVPPPGSIAALFACPEPWCTHRGWTGGQYHDDTLQLAKFSSQLRQAHPRLCDAALARDDNSRWVRNGWTHIDKDANPATLARYGRRACLRQDAFHAQMLLARHRKPSSVNWVICDSTLARELRKAGYSPHVHEPPPHHLHDYQARPVNVAEE